MKKKIIITVCALILLGAAIFAAIHFIDIKTPEEYYNEEDKEKENVIGSVTISIRCDRVIGMAEHIPSDGIILDTATFDIEEGDTVYSILIEAAKGGAGRIPTANVITFTAEEMEDWKTWQKKLFAKIPLSMRKLRPEFVMTAETFEANIMTLEDTNGRPVYRETYNPVTGDETATFKGREVVFVEEGGIKSFDSAAAGEYFGMMWVPEKAYLINSNLQFSYKKYFDEATNQYVTKALVICDGKVLDGKYIYLLKKA